jgi:hypothetical protein
MQRALDDKADDSFYSLHLESGNAYIHTTRILLCWEEGTIPSD